GDAGHHVRGPDQRHAGARGRDQRGDDSKRPAAALHVSKGCGGRREIRVVTFTSEQGGIRMSDPNWARLDRPERAFAVSAASSTRWIAWMPLLFVAAFLYWSLALGLGGLSLLAASAITSGAEGAADFSPS